MKTVLKVLTFFTAFTLIGCSSESLYKKIETAEVDMLNEESLMRYNTNRLEKVGNEKNDFISKALYACHQQKFIKGKSILEQEMHVNKVNPFYWNALGTCYLLSNELTKSQFFYDLGIESLPKLKAQDKDLAEATLTNNIGLIHLKHRRYKEAFDLFSKSRSLLPNFFTPQFNIAQLFMEFNENDKALEVLLKLQEKNPNDIDLLYSLSLIYFRKNDFDKSFSSINRIKKNYLNRPDIVGLYAFNLMKKNRLTEAKEIIEKRIYADEFDNRNKMLLEEINQKIKERTAHEN